MPTVAGTPQFLVPPALRLGNAFGGGWAGQFLERNKDGRRALAPTGKAGWVGQFPECDNGGQLALAATHPSPMPQLWRPTHSPRAALQLSESSVAASPRV